VLVTVSEKSCWPDCKGKNCEKIAWAVKGRANGQTGGSRMFPPKRGRGNRHLRKGMFREGPTAIQGFTPTTKGGVKGPGKGGTKFCVAGTPMNKRNSLVKRDANRKESINRGIT